MSAAPSFYGSVPPVYLEENRFGSTKELSPEYMIRMLGDSIESRTQSLRINTASFMSVLEDGGIPNRA